MVPSYLVGATVAAAAAAVTARFAYMDCNPSLWMYATWRTRPAISDQSIWIIGASSGIGRELSLLLARNENRLILSARNKQNLEAVASECRQRNPSANIQIHELDVTNQTALMEAGRMIQCDICVLNAGKGYISLASELSSDDAMDMMQSNALWQITLAPHLRCRHMVVMSSIAGILPVPLSAAYAASKHALQGYFKSLEVERDDLKIDIICPGPVDTEFHANGKGDNKHMTSRSQSGSPSTSSSSSPLKMSAERCAELTLAAMSRTHRRQHGSTVWICQQPTLTALYLAKILPASAFAALSRRIGAKRVDMYKRGLDLYDPKSWK